MRSLPWKRFAPAPSFRLPASISMRSGVTSSADREGADRTVGIDDIRHRSDALLFVLHSAGCDECRRIVREMSVRRDIWDRWETALIVVWTGEDGGAPEFGRVAVDLDGMLRRRFAPGEDPGALIAVIDHRGRWMDGWAVPHPEPIDWREVAETVKWTAVQEPECGACEVAPGWDDVI